MYEVQTRWVPERRLATIKRHVKLDELVPFIDEAEARLGDFLQGAGVHADPGFFVIYHGQVDEGHDGPVEVCRVYEGQVAPAENVTLRTEPAHGEAFTTLTKGQTEFPEVLRAYDAVGQWMQERHKTCLLGGSREVYLTDLATIGEHDLAAEIAYPY